MKRILLAEDSDALRRVIESHLQEMGYEVLAVSDGQQAIQQIETADVFDLVLTDDEMPGQNGTSVIKAARKRSSITKTILMSFKEGVAVLAKRAGADEFLQKPRDFPERFEEVVRRLLE